MCVHCKFDSCCSPASCPAAPSPVGVVCLPLPVRCSCCGFRSFAAWPAAWRGLWCVCPRCAASRLLRFASLPLAWRVLLQSLPRVPVD